MEKPLILSRKDRAMKFNIDCSGPNNSDGIVFKGGEWVPGGEYIAKLTVRNVSTKTMKVKYRLPSTRFFSMPYPEVLTLSAGMEYTVDVTFRPTQYENYTDTIYFKVIEQTLADKCVGFHVPVRARISRLQLQTIGGVDFGFVCVNELSYREFELKNIGQVPAPFRWGEMNPFIISPTSGVVEVGQSQTIRVDLLPYEASVLVSKAICYVGEGINAIKPDPVMTVKLSAIGKYPHITLSEPEINYGDIQVGAPADECTKEVLLMNHSVVPVSFKIDREYHDIESTFSLSPLEGIVPFQSSVTIKIVYHPQAFNVFSSERFRIITPGGNIPDLTLSAMSRGPNVHMNKIEDPRMVGKALPDSISFNEVEVGRTASRVLFLKNPSELPVHFEFITQECHENPETNGSVFEFDRTRGVIPAGFETNVNILFKPQFPANFYKRIFCLIENQHPSFIDVMGTSYILAKGQIKEQHPAPIRHSHIQAYRNRQAAGLGHLNAEELDKMLEDEGMSDLFCKVGYLATKPMGVPRVKNPTTRSGESSRIELAASNEFFIPITDEDLQITLDTEDIDFGFANRSTEVQRVVTLNNRTNGKVSVHWKNTKDGAFIISPEMIDVGPMKDSTFTITWKPKRSNVYYCEDLEALVYFKNQRSFRLANDATITPPWMVSLRSHGHSFPAEQSLPDMSISIPGGKLTMPTCYLGDAVYHTILIKNKSNLPGKFEIDPDQSKTFSFRPAIGLIPAESFQLVEVRFQPKQKGLQKFTMKTNFNNNPHSITETLLMGLAEEPKLKVLDATDGAIYFKPTSIGLLSTVTFRVHNASRLPIIYHCNLPNHIRTAFSITPIADRLKGKETKEIMLHFIPKADVQYGFNLPIETRSISGPSPPFRDARQIGEAAAPSDLETINIKVVAPTAGPALSFEPTKLDYSVLLVNDNASQPLTLCNNSDCDVKYQLYYMRCPKIINDEPEWKVDAFGNQVLVEKKKEVPKLIEAVSEEGTAEVVIKDTGGILPARSRTITFVTFQPFFAEEYTYALMYTTSPAISFPQDGKPQALTAEQSLIKLSEEIQKSDILLSSSSSPQNLPNICRITGCATFPSVTVRDLRFQGGGVGTSAVSLWEQFSLYDLNKALMTPLTKQEVAVNNLSTIDKSKLPVYPFTFPPHVVGTPSSMVYIELRNSGKLPTFYSIHLPNESDIELEQWADKGQATEEDFYNDTIIDELKCFEIYPKRGRLEPGETLTLTLAYHYTSTRFNGKHQLPILFKIAQGKQFIVKLQGRTIDKKEAYIQPFINPSSEFIMAPVVIGTPVSDAPTQFLEIYNPSSMDIDVEVDDSVLQKYNKKNFNCEIFSLLSNSKLRILAGQRIFLKCKFTPYEAKTYKAKILLKYKSKEGTSSNSKITLVGRGYDIRSEDWHRRMIPDVNLGLIPPPRQYIFPPESLATLSEDKIMMGRILCRSTASYVIILRNKLLDKPINFEIDDSHQLVQQGIVSFQPSCGAIGPSEYILIKCKVNGLTNPMIINNHFEVKVSEFPMKGNKYAAPIDLNTANSFVSFSSTVADMGKSHEPIASRPTECVITNLETNQKIPDGREAHLPTTESNLPPAGPEGVPVKRKYPAKVSKYNTTKSLRSFKSAGTGKSSKKDDLPPEEPISVLLDLHLQCEIVRESCSYFYQVEEEDRVFIPEKDRFILPEVDPKLEVASSWGNEEDEEQSINVDPEGGNILKDLLGSMLNDILTSQDIKNALSKIPTEQNPVFYSEIKRSRSLVSRFAALVGVDIVRGNHPIPVDQIESKLNSIGMEYKRVFLQQTINSCPLHSISSDDGNALHDVVYLKDLFNNMTILQKNSFEKAIIEAEYELKQQSPSTDENNTGAMKDQEKKGETIEHQFYQSDHSIEEKPEFHFDPDSEEVQQAVIRVQSMIRQALSRRKLEVRKRIKINNLKKDTILESDCKALMMQTFEETMSNLINESLFGDFNPLHPPKQYILSPKSGQ